MMMVEVVVLAVQVLLVVVAEAAVISTGNNDKLGVASPTYPCRPWKFCPVGREM